MPTVFSDLNEFLAGFVDEVTPILGDDLVGVYLVGSFALRDGDRSSDCDFLAVVVEDPTPDQEAGLRELHAEIPTRPGYWAINFEGSYAPMEDLTSLGSLGSDWLYVNRGGTGMEWSPHCNVVDTRWVLQQRGIPLVGPPPQEFAAPVPGDLLRSRMRELIPGFLDDLATWADFDLVWTQRYAVETTCRMLYTLERGEVESKRRSLEWARAALPRKWRSLIEQALEDRAVEWNARSDPALVAAAIEFARFAASRLGEIDQAARDV